MTTTTYRLFVYQSKPEHGNGKKVYHTTLLDGTQLQSDGIAFQVGIATKTYPTFCEVLDSVNTQLHNSGVNGSPVEVIGKNPFPNNTAFMPVDKSTWTHRRFVPPSAAQLALTRIRARKK